METDYEDVPDDSENNRVDSPGRTDPSNQKKHKTDNSAQEQDLSNNRSKSFDSSQQRENRFRSPSNRNRNKVNGTKVHQTGHRSTSVDKGRDSSTNRSRPSAVTESQVHGRSLQAGNSVSNENEKDQRKQFRIGALQNGNNRTNETPGVANAANWSHTQGIHASNQGCNLELTRKSRTSVNRKEINLQQQQQQQGCEPYLVVQLSNSSSHDVAGKDSQSQMLLQQPQTDATTRETNNNKIFPASNNTGPQDCRQSGMDSGNTVTMDNGPCAMESTPDDGLEKYAGNFVQCRKCNRPHGLFNGTQIKHFDEHGEICGGGGGSAFDRLSVRARANPTVEISSNFQRECNSKRLGPKVRTNPRVSEKNFRFTRSASLDSSKQRDSQSQATDRNDQQLQPMGGGNPVPVIKVQESDSADTWNEYDIQTGSDMSSGKLTSGGSIQSQRSSIASSSDSAASNLYGSESSHDSSPKSRLPVSGEKRAKPLNESDSSNDTFSEYDIRSSDSYTSTKGITDEYDFYLSKIRQNLWLKQETLRVIRESESSEYETGDYQCTSLGSSVYTTSSLSDAPMTMTSTQTEVTSSQENDVSNCSAFNDSGMKLKGILKHSNSTSCPTQPKRSIVINEEGANSKSKSSSKQSSTQTGAVHARKKPNRRKSTSAIPDPLLECYTLPDFASDSGPKVSGSPNGKISSSNSNSSLDSSVSMEIANAAAVSSPTGSAITGSDNSRSHDSDILERLSCRATNFRSETPPLLPAPSVPNNPTLGGDSVSAFTKVSPSSKAPSGGLVPKGMTSLGGKVHMRGHAQNRTAQHNRLLGDLMKINHDRQLLFL